MTSEALELQRKGFRDIVLGLSNIGRVQEYGFGAQQGLLLSLVTSATNTSSRAEAIQWCQAEISLLFQLAQRDELPLSSEFESLLAECKALGIQFTQTAPLPPSKPLASFPREPPVVHSVFVDESGTPAFDEHTQPVFSIVGVLVDDSAITVFDEDTRALLARYELPLETELHAHPCIKGLESFERITEPQRRFELLRDFVALGMRHTVGVHYMSLLKPMMREEVRKRLKRLKLDAYTANVIWFNLTLQAGRVSKIGFNRYRYFFDRTDRYGKDIRRILKTLKDERQAGVRVSAVEGDPVEVGSEEHRFVQLADTIGYFLTRYRQFEVRSFKPMPTLLKYEAHVREVHGIIKPKVLDYISDGAWMMIDWKALEEWTPYSEHAKSNRKQIEQ